MILCRGSKEHNRKPEASKRVSVRKVRCFVLSAPALQLLPKFMAKSDPGLNAPLSLPPS